MRKLREAADARRRDDERAIADFERHEPRVLEDFEARLRKLHSDEDEKLERVALVPGN